MALRYTDVDAPPAPSRRGPRSPFLELVESLEGKRGKAVRIASDEDGEIDRFYRSLIQWRIRNRAKFPDLQVQRDGDEVFVWLEADGPPDPRKQPTAMTKPRASEESLSELRQSARRHPRTAPSTSEQTGGR